MTDYEDYENNLAFPPTTDRTQSTIELIEKIEKLTKQVEIAFTGLYDIAEHGETRWDMSQARWYLDRIKELDK